MSGTNAGRETVTFLGTGGARFMIITQLLDSGGLWLDLDGTEILLDPGPGCIVQSTRRKLRAEKLSAIIVSHRHLDHSGDLNVMVEAMTEGGHRRHGWLFAPADAFDSEPIIFSYLKRRLSGVGILQEGKSYQIDNISFSTPVRHIHAVETYGMVFQTPHHTFSYIADTRYFAGLTQSYGGDLLIVNCAFVDPRPPSLDPSLPADHLSVPETEEIVRHLKPKMTILTHFGMGMWRARPWEIAERMSQRTGVRVVAAQDGMKFDLADLDGAGN